MGVVLQEEAAGMPKVDDCDSWFGCEGDNRVN